jgi:ATP-dependent DNA helicase RecG
MTTHAQIQQWVRLGESENQEFKASTSTQDKAIQTLCGMLNKQGGRVLFGIRPDGNIEGQQTTDRTLEKLYAELSRVDPPVVADIERVLLENGNEVLIVTVPRGGQKPYFTSDWRNLKWRCFLTRYCAPDR